VHDKRHGIVYLSNAFQGLLSTDVPKPGLCQLLSLQGLPRSGEKTHCGNSDIFHDTWLLDQGMLMSRRTLGTFARDSM